MTDAGTIRQRASALLPLVGEKEKGPGTVNPGQIDDLLLRASRVGNRDNYTDSFVIKALRFIAEDKTPPDPYDREDLPDLIQGERDNANKGLREWLHASRERARFLHLAQERYGPIFDGSELMQVACCLEEIETYEAVREILGETGSA